MCKQACKPYMPGHVRCMVICWAECLPLSPMANTQAGRVDARQHRQFPPVGNANALLTSSNPTHCLVCPMSLRQHTKREATRMTRGSHDPADGCERDARVTTSSISFTSTAEQVACDPDSAMTHLPAYPASSIQHKSGHAGPTRVVWSDCCLCWVQSFLAIMKLHPT